MRERSRLFPCLQLSRQQAGVVILVLCCVLLAAANLQAQTDPLPSWNDGPAKKAILAFVQATTDPANPHYVPPEARIAAFDQDGTTWVEQPMYPQTLYCIERLRELAKTQPELQATEPFKTVLSGDPAALAKLNGKDYETIFAATFTGMTVEAFADTVKTWLATARDPHYKRPYTELVYQPMLEVMRYLRANGYKTFFVTGGGQDFVRVFAEQVYGIPPEHVIATIYAKKFGYDQNGKPVVTMEPKLLLNAVHKGKPEGISMMLGRRPYAAFGNSDGDKDMLEYTQAGDGLRLTMLVHHDDAAREYAYGPASKVGTFSDALLSEAHQKGWLIISMKNDWKRLFAWEK